MLLLIVVACGCEQDHRGVVTSRDTARQFENERKAILPDQADGSIDDLSMDAVAILRRLPGVGKVEQSRSIETPKHRIIHLVDLHYVEPADYAADLRD